MNNELWSKDRGSWANKEGLFDFKLNVGNEPFTTPPTCFRGETAMARPK